MAKNDVVLLDSLVAKARTQIAIARDDSELFELFAFDQVLKDFDPSPDELESGWTDGGTPPILKPIYRAKARTTYFSAHCRPTSGSSRILRALFADTCLSQMSGTIWARC
jgi:hypothetical protein